ncbi:MAG: hypothetical protein EOM88_02920 [Clostridia bacterium]|nr:hypothetical protein [Clostridia bacterium]
MKKIKISGDLVPLSRREQVVVNLIIVCIFQFLFFFTPVLAVETIEESGIINNNIINLAFSSKGEADPLVANLIETQNKISELVETTKVMVDSPIGPVNNILPINKEVQPQVKVISSSIRTLTAYNSLPEQTDDTPCITANGFNLCKHWTEDTIAANFLKFGTKVRIPELFGDRIFVVRDRMNKRFSDRVDVWLKDKQDARKFGKQTARIEIVEMIE